MTDRFLFDLAPGWKLGADANQWMLMRGRKRHAEVTWQPVAYIGSTTSVLWRCMREKGIGPTLEAQAKLNALPERFLDWRAMWKLKGNKL